MNIFDNEKGISELATLNFVLALFGYQLIASVFMPFMKVSDDSQIFTIPYRAFSLGLSIYLIFRSGGRFNVNLPLVIKCLFIYWGILIIRLVYDFFIQDSMPLDGKRNAPVVLYIFGIILPTALAYLRTYDKVDYKKALIWSIVSLLIIVISNFAFNVYLFSEVSGRIAGGVALNTISFGHCGGSLSLLSLFLWKYGKTQNLLYHVLSVILFCIGAYIMIRAGSRGPLVSFLLLALLFYSLEKSNFVLMALSLLGATLFVYILRNQLLSLIKDIQPIMYERVMMTIEKGDLSGRQSLYQKALEIWYDNLAFGGQFNIYHFIGGKYRVGYSHNIILDSLVAGGIWGGGLMLFFYYRAFVFLRECLIRHSEYIWLALIFLQKFLACLSSGCFYMDSLLTIGIIAFGVLKIANSQDDVAHNMEV